MNIKHIIRKILKEETQNLENFTNTITKIYPELEPYKEKFEKFITDSGCQNIEFAGFNYPALGMATHNKILINKQLIYSRRSLSYILFVIFHEVAHHYQFKKYGAKIMYDIYRDEIPLKKAAEILKNIELVADEFGLRKLREFEKMGIENEFPPSSVYKYMPNKQLEELLKKCREDLRKNNIEDVEKISEFFYNLVKREL